MVIIIPRQRSFTHRPRKGKIDFGDQVTIDDMSRCIKHHNAKLVIIDPLIASANGLNENNSGDVSGVLTDIQRLVDENQDCCVLIAHHVSKSQREKSARHSMRGSSALSGWYDFYYKVEYADKFEDVQKAVIVI